LGIMRKLQQNINHLPPDQSGVLLLDKEEKRSIFNSNLEFNYKFWSMNVSPPGHRPGGVWEQSYPGGGVKYLVQLVWRIVDFLTK